MHLDGGSDIAGFQVAFGSEDDTVNAEAQPLGELESVPGGISLSILYQYFVHDCDDQ